MRAAADRVDVADDKAAARQFAGIAERLGDDLGPDARGIAHRDRDRDRLGVRCTGHTRLSTLPVMRRFWLVFSQSVTVLLAAWFVVATLKPEWIGRGAVPRTSGAGVSLVEAPSVPTTVNG